MSISLKGFLVFYFVFIFLIIILFVLRRKSLIRCLYLNLVIWWINQKLIIASGNNWIWCIYKYLIVLEKYLFLLDILKYSFIWNLKYTCYNLIIYLYSIILYLSNTVCLNWRTITFQFLNESITNIKQSILRCRLVYIKNWGII